MKLTHLCYYSLFLVLVAVPFTGDAAYLVQDGKLVNEKEAATLSVQEHYSLAMEAFRSKDWDELIRQAIIVTKNFPTSPFAEDATFYLGVGYFNIHDFQLANQQYSRYLKKQATPKHFEEAIEYKFKIAEKFKGGAKRHLLGWEGMPQWMPAIEEALSIYDEVITALPHHDLSAQSLYGKAKIYYKDEDFRPCIEAYQTIIHRFPKHHLAPESYIGIGEVYFTQCKTQYPDPDFLDLAEINLRKFQHDFPGEERVALAEKMFLDMKEVYATNLYETGRFFERTKKPHASVIYYNKVMAQYPDTKIAAQTQKRLSHLNKHEKDSKDKR